MGKRNLYSLKEALESPGHVKDLVIFLEIMYHDFETLPLETLAVMKKLKKLIIFVTKDYSKADAKKALAHIPELDIRTYRDY
jgi:hypothetical protein